jgi:hypothetical protein
MNEGKGSNYFKGYEGSRGQGFKGPSSSSALAKNLELSFYNYTRREK